VKKDYSTTLTVLPKTFDPGYYVLAFPKDSELRDAINTRLIEVAETPGWIAVLFKYVSL